MRLLVDVDGTLTIDEPDISYASRRPRSDVIDKINALHERGVEVILYSARNMRSYKGNLGKINKHTLPVLLSWLDRNHVRFNEIHVGKPWCGIDGFYVQQRSMRPSDFLKTPLESILKNLEPSVD